MNLIKEYTKILTEKSETPKATNTGALLNQAGTVLEEPSHLVDIKAKQRVACGFQNV